MIMPSNSAGAITPGTDILARIAFASLLEPDLEVSDFLFRGVRLEPPNGASRDPRPASAKLGAFVVVLKFVPVSISVPEAVTGMRTMSFTEARNNLKRAIEAVNEDHAPLLITRQKGANAVLMSQEDFNALDETAYLLRSPANAERLRKAKDEIEAQIAKDRKAAGRAKRRKR
jgi:antitoxin YefM